MVLLATLRVNDLLLRALDIGLKVHERVEYGLRAWWASRDVHINGDDLIDASYCCVVIVESTG